MCEPMLSIEAEAAGSELTDTHLKSERRGRVVLGTAPRL
jgi:hypothetical protein